MTMRTTLPMTLITWSFVLSRGTTVCLDRSLGHAVQLRTKVQATVRRSKTKIATQGIEPCPRVS
jgi:hypothetical protein